MPFAVNGGVHIYYEVQGSGPPLVLLHGLSDTMEGLRENGLAAALAPSRRLILIDARGHGRSDKPHDPGAYDLALRVADVLAVLDAESIRTSGYYGYSMGGVIGYGLAAYAPDRLSSLVVGGAHPYASSTEFFRQIFAAGLKAWLAVLQQAAGPLPETAAARIMENDLDALRASIANDRQAVFPKTPELPFPVRLMAADGDPVFALIRQFATEAGARFFPLKGFNHFSAYVRPQDQVPVILGAGAFVPSGAES
ncbi:MAG: alpha/beta fold hydrolase [Bryobacterales bacterium]|nr:alpha/beta fold hydrolase [Bryobacterales bacterium]